MARRCVAVAGMLSLVFAAAASAKPITRLGVLGGGQLPPPVRGEAAAGIDAEKSSGRIDAQPQAAAATPLPKKPPVNFESDALAGTRYHQRNGGAASLYSEEVDSLLDSFLQQDTQAPPAFPARPEAPRTVPGSVFLHRDTLADDVHLFDSRGTLRSLHDLQINQSGLRPSGWLLLPEVVDGPIPFSGPDLRPSEFWRSVMPMQLKERSQRPVESKNRVTTIEGEL